MSSATGGGDDSVVGEGETDGAGASAEEEDDIDELMDMSCSFRSYPGRKCRG